MAFVLGERGATEGLKQVSDTISTVCGVTMVGVQDQGPGKCHSSHRDGGSRDAEK